jgi:hypothetical protein
VRNLLDHYTDEELLRELDRRKLKESVLRELAYVEGNIDKVTDIVRAADPLHDRRTIKIEINGGA